MRFRFREAPPMRFRWIGPSDNAEPLRLPDIGPVAAVIGPNGPSGPPGPRGVDGDGAADPGDLTLYLLNALI